MTVILFRITMPCCVIVGCRSGYEPTHKDAANKEEKIKYQLFPFPKSARHKNIWIARINRGHWTPTINSKVCRKHFEDSEFSHFPGEILKDKTVRKYYQLKENALPSIHLRGPDISIQEPQAKKAKLADIQFTHNYQKKAEGHPEEAAGGGELGEHPANDDQEEQPDVYVDHLEHAGIEFELETEAKKTRLGQIWLQKRCFFDFLTK